jgi:hypothetical protein
MPTTTTLPPLRPYQQEIVDAIWNAVETRSGHSFSVKISRQAGKNELSAQLEVALLLQYANKGGEIVKTAPTLSPQLAISKRRLINRLIEAGAGDAVRVEGDTVQVGLASITFLSGQPDANVVGHTASLLLEVDEAQDLDAEKFERDFRPMILSTGATVVFYGTAWESDSLLERVKTHHLELGATDGIRRHFEYDYEAVSRDFPEYLPRALEQKKLLGETSPIWLSQYRLQPQEGVGRLFRPEHLEKVRGEHEPFPNMPVEQAIARLGKSRGLLRHEPKPAHFDDVFIAGLDIGGMNPGAERDPTVLTVGRLLGPNGESDWLHGGSAIIEVVNVMSWQATWDVIQAEIERWHDFYYFESFALDSTGIGHHAAGMLEGSMDKRIIESVNFTEQSKSQLCYELYDAVLSGRLKLYQGDDRELRQCWQQLAKARIETRPRTGIVSFDVPPNQGHDDHLMSLALLVRAAGVYKPRRAYAYRRGDIL